MHMARDLPALFGKSEHPVRFEVDCLGRALPHLSRGARIEGGAIMRERCNRPIEAGPNAQAIAYRPVLAALADPTRWTIFERTLSGPRPVRDIAGQLPVSRVAVSQHLKVLQEAGLVTCRRDGPRRLYRADPRAIGALVSMMNTIWREALETRTQDAAEGDQ